MITSHHIIHSLHNNAQFNSTLRETNPMGLHCNLQRNKTVLSSLLYSTGAGQAISAVSSKLSWELPEGLHDRLRVFVSFALYFVYVFTFGWIEAIFWVKSCRISWISWLLNDEARQMTEWMNDFFLKIIYVLFAIIM